MNRVLILMAVFFLSVVIISCGGDDTGNTGDTGDTVDTGNNDDTDDTGNTGNTGDTGDTGQTDDTADIEETDDTGDTGYTGECTGSDKFCLSHDGLNWSDVVSKGMTWDQAVNYCINLGGRLPTISELRTLIKNCPATETGGECEVTDECLSYEDCWTESSCYNCEYDENNPGKYSVFGDLSWFWSSSERSDDESGVWHVGFQGGNVYSAYKYDHGYVRCVR